MKKILFSVFAVAALASCAQDEIIGVANGDAIAFDNAFVDNATKAIDDSYTNAKNNLEAFQVYGTVTNKQGQVANIFDCLNVKKGGTGVGTNWTYSSEYTQYWVSDNSYSFKAVVDGNIENVTEVVVDVDTHMPTAVKLIDASQQKDVLYAEMLNINYAGNVQPVKFTFNHLLAKAKFTVKNEMTVGNGNSYKVKNVKIENAVSSATYTIGTGWASHNGEYELLFGDVVAADATTVVDAAKMEKGAECVSNYERLLVPQENCPLTISVDVEYYIQDKVSEDDFLNDSFTKTIYHTVTLEAGKAYNFVLTLGNPGEPITFDVEKVEDWVNAGDVAVAEVSVATAAALKDALAQGGNITLTQDIAVTEALEVAAGKTVALNLGGKTLTNGVASRAGAEIIPIVNRGNMTLSNGKIVSGAAYETRKCLYNYGTMTIEGVEFEQTYNKAGAAINNEGKLTINGATVKSVFYAVWTSGANAETVINGGTFTAKNNETVRDTWAYAINVLNGAKLTINGGTFTGNHGVVAATGEGSEATLNAGTFNCTATYTGNSDWVLYAAENGIVKYNASNCTLTTGNASGAVYGTVETL